MNRLHIFSAVFVLAVLFSATTAFAQSGDRQPLENEIRAGLAELKETERLFLAPSAKDQRKNAEFLSLPDTGLIRLLPRETFQHKLTINGGGAYYSFARLTHEYGFGSDIELQQREFTVGFAGADFGIMTRLGKKSLENATLDDPAALFLVSFSAPTIEAAAREQYQRGRAGFDVNGFTYKSSQPLKTKNTYLLRSIVYDRSDVLVAFRLLREDIDGSAIILWKILKRFPVPSLARP